MKRLMDLVAAALALVAASPLLALIALAVRVQLGSPVLFVQWRPGRGGRLFRMYKFRTMREATDAQGTPLPDEQRLTRFGRFLRSTSLDELPELLNVLRGEMSLVGPRPLLPQYLPRYTPEQARRHEVRPGITGWAQIHGRNGVPWEQRFALDVWYVEHRSLRLDLWILLATMWTVARRQGIHAPQHATMAEYQGTNGDGHCDGDASGDESALANPSNGRPAAAAPSERGEVHGAARRRVFLSPPHMSGHERELLMEAFDSNWIAPLGPHVEALEREFAERLGVSHAVALSSGTAALHLALLLAGVGRGDEVLTSTMTFAATANAIAYVGAAPVFIDSDRETWNMDPDLLAVELETCVRRGNRPKAVLVVDLYGQCANYEALAKTCQLYEIPILEDAAEALGATWQGRPAGTFGAMGCFSFNGNKILTTSGGGMLVTPCKPWAERARFLATQARDPAPHYQHSQVGYNYRMSNLLAAVGRGQLRVLDDRVRRRRANFAFYRRELGELPGIGFMPEPAGARSTRWLSCITIDPARFGADREAVRQALEQQNIESRPVWKPMHLQPAFRGCRVRGGAVSAAIFREGLCLPSGSNLSAEDRARVVRTIHAVAGRRAAATTAAATTAAADGAR